MPGLFLRQFRRRQLSPLFTDEWQRCSPAWGSPRSICDKMQVTSDMANKIASREQRRQKSSMDKLGACVNQLASESLKTLAKRSTFQTIWLAATPSSTIPKKRMGFSARKFCVEKRLRIRDAFSVPNSVD